MMDKRLRMRLIFTFATCVATTIASLFMVSVSHIVWCISSLVSPCGLNGCFQIFGKWLAQTPGCCNCGSKTPFRFPSSFNWIQIILDRTPRRSSYPTYRLSLLLAWRHFFSNPSWCPLKLVYNLETGQVLWIHLREWSCDYDTINTLASTWIAWHSLDTAIRGLSPGRCLVVMGGLLSFEWWKVGLLHTSPSG